MLAGAGTASAAARVREPGVVAPSPAPMNLPAGPMAMDQPETSAASGPSSESALRVSSDSATPPARTWFPLEGLYPPDLPITSSFVKNGPAVAVAVLETVKPSVPVEGPDLRIGTAGAGRDAAGRNGAGPVFQQAGITSYDITLKPGSNLISLTLMPDDTAIEAVLAGILDRVETVWQYDTSGPDPKWRSYAPGAPSDLRVMRDGPGYWVHLKDDGTGDEALTITGGDATGPARRVVQGWNPVGFTATTAGDAATDRAALVALYNATDGANWLNNGNWLSNAPMGEWHGVTTDSDGRVTHLNLRHNQLTGEIPAELGNLTNLTHLDLPHNQLTGGIPAELGNLTNLEGLWLQRNQLTGEIPGELGNLTNLERLYLTNTQLTGEIPAELGNLTNLTQLFLHNNQLSGGIPTELGNLTNLEWLYLFNNQLTGEIPAELGSLTNLERLYLTNNQLTGEIPAELGNLTNLTHLDLPHNQLTGGIPAELGNLTNLVRLELQRNQLTGGIPAELGSLTNLEGLRLNSNQLTGEIPAELGNLTNLKDLYLNNNQLTGEIPAELGNLTNLEWLYLNNNQLTGEIPAELGNLTNLTHLDLPYNQLTGEIPLEQLFLGENGLTGCIPGGLRDVPLNDLAQLGLDYCNLQTLWLSGNQLTGCIPNGLRGIETNDLSQLGLPFCDMPGAPTIATQIVPGDASLTVAWAAPTNTGSSAITAYDLRYIETGAADKSDANWTVVEDVWAAGSGSLQHTLSGLTGGTQYDVQVRAVNAAGASAWSATVTGTTTSAVLPGAPTGLTAAVAAGKAQAVLSWIAPTDTGGAPITGYKIEASDDGNNPWTEVYTTTGDATGYTDEGADSNGPMFEVGTTRHYRVSAINSVGTGPPSNVAVTEGLVDRYDTNGNGTIEKNEVIAAINDYLFGEGDQAISKSDVIKLINDYLFG